MELACLPFTRLCRVRFHFILSSICFNLSSSGFIHIVTPNILPFNVDQVLFSGASVQSIFNISKGDNPLNVHWEFKRDSHYLRIFSKVVQIGLRR